MDARIGEVASQHGLSLDPGAQAQLAAFGELFLTWNERINLGGAISAADLVAKHFVDSFAASAFIEANSRVVDVGSGGGLPGIPLALVRSDIVVELFEPTAKKVAFLRTAARELHLRDRITIHPTRVELHAIPAGPFDVAMSRATLAPAEWLNLGRRLVRPRGTIIVFGTGGPGDPAEDPRCRLRYGSDRQLLVYDQTAVLQVE
jgi:16S rRNA (guanine527-N7)-methyltransferase